MPQWELAHCYSSPFFHFFSTEIEELNLTFQFSIGFMNQLFIHFLNCLRFFYFQIQVTLFSSIQINFRPFFRRFSFIVKDCFDQKYKQIQDIRLQIMTTKSKYQTINLDNKIKVSNRKFGQRNQNTKPQIMATKSKYQITNSDNEIKISNHKFR